MKGAAEHPEYRTLVGIDMEGYGRAERTDRARVLFRRHLARWCATLLRQCGVGPDQYHQQSTGDGYLFSIDPRVPRDILMARLLNGLRHRLISFNRDRPLDDRLRLRVAFHGGDVLRDPGPFEGTATVLMARLLNSDVLRICLRTTTEPLAAIASEPLHDGIIRHGYQPIDPAAWYPVIVATKEGPQPAWVHVPGDPSAPVRAQVVAA